MKCLVHQTPRGSFGSVAFVGISVADFSTDDPELTHMLCESLLISDNHITPDGEDAAQNVCSRLHQTINTVLELLNHANTQVNDTYLIISQQTFCLMAVLPV